MELITTLLGDHAQTVAAVLYGLIIIAKNFMETPDATTLWGKVYKVVVDWTTFTYTEKAKK